MTEQIGGTMGAWTRGNACVLYRWTGDAWRVQFQRAGYQATAVDIESRAGLLAAAEAYLEPGGTLAAALRVADSHDTADRRARLYHAALRGAR